MIDKNIQTKYCLEKFMLAKNNSNQLSWMICSSDSLADGTHGWSESSSPNRADVPADLLAYGSQSTHLD